MINRLRNLYIGFGTESLSWVLNFICWHNCNAFIKNIVFKMLFLDSWIPLYLQQVMQEKRFISKLNWKRLDSRFNHSLNLWARYIIIKLLHKVTKRVLTLYCVIASIILTYFFRHCVYCTYTLQWWTQGFTRGVFITWQKREGRPS